MLTVNPMGKRRKRSGLPEEQRAEMEKWFENSIPEGLSRDEVVAAVEKLLVAGPDFLSSICTCLRIDQNEPWVPELRRLLDLWWASGPNLGVMLYDQHPEILTAIRKEYRPVYTPGDSGRAYSINGIRTNWGSRAEDALNLFIRITLSDDWWRIALCPQCNQYFVRKTQKRSTYCSQRCASAATATKRTAEIRRQRAEWKLETARKAIARYGRLSAMARGKKDWKEFVCGFEPAAEITLTYLARAINAGNLQPPKQEK